MFKQILGLALLISSMTSVIACGRDIPDGVMYIKLPWQPNVIDLIQLRQKDSDMPKNPQQLVEQYQPGSTVVRVTTEWIGSAGPHAAIYFCRK